LVDERSEVSALLQVRSPYAQVRGVVEELALFAIQAHLPEAIRILAAERSR
jgi:hypothetical protein